MVGGDLNGWSQRHVLWASWVWRRLNEVDYKVDLLWSKSLEVGVGEVVFCANGGSVGMYFVVACAMLWNEYVIEM